MAPQDQWVQDTRMQVPESIVSVSRHSSGQFAAAKAEIFLCRQHENVAVATSLSPTHRLAAGAGVGVEVEVLGLGSGQKVSGPALVAQHVVSASTAAIDW